MANSVYALLYNKAVRYMKVLDSLRGNRQRAEVHVGMVEHRGHLRLLICLVRCDFLRLTLPMLAR